MVGVCTYYNYFIYCVECAEITVAILILCSIMLGRSGLLFCVLLLLTGINFRHIRTINVRGGTGNVSLLTLHFFSAVQSNRPYQYIATR